MKNLLRAGLLLVGVVSIISLYAFYERREPGNIPSASVNPISIPIPDTDRETGMPVLRHHLNSLIYTRDIAENIATSIFDQLRDAAFFTRVSEWKIILGKEPNNYVLFFQSNNPVKDQEFISKLPALSLLLSAAVLNHQPLVIKIINAKNEIVKVVR